MPDAPYHGPKNSAHVKADAARSDNGHPFAYGLLAIEHIDIGKDIVPVCTFKIHYAWTDPRSKDDFVIALADQFFPP